MLPVNCPYRFQPDYQAFIDRQISNEIPNQVAIIMDFCWRLLLHCESSLLQFNPQSIFVDFLQKSRTQNIMAFECAANHLLRKLLVLHSRL